MKTIDKKFDNLTPFRLFGVELKKLLNDNDAVYIYLTVKHNDWKPWLLLGVFVIEK